MKDHLTIISVLIFLMIMLSCEQKSYLSKDELEAFIQDENNGLIKKKEIGQINLALTYRPNDLVTIQRTGRNADSASMFKIRRQYSSYAYFILSMNLAGKDGRPAPDMEIFKGNLQAHSFQMSDKVVVTTSLKDTISVTDYVFDRGYGKGCPTLMFAFNREKFVNTSWISFNLKEFGMGFGDHRFRFQTRDIDQVPCLKDFEFFEK